jgi:hypothetical protein
MRKDEVSRRFVVGALGVGAAAAAVGVAERFEVAKTAADAVPPEERDDSTSASSSESLAQVSLLLAPLTVGARLGRWTVQELIPIKDGAISVVLQDTGQQRFQLDVCARDDAADARHAPGRSEHFEVFLANQGDGETSTHEDHGLAAMALADLIRGNEHRVERTAFQTLRQRSEAKSARLHVT